MNRVCLIFFLESPDGCTLWEASNREVVSVSDHLDGLVAYQLPKCLGIS